MPFSVLLFFGGGGSVLRTISVRRSPAETAAEPQGFYTQIGISEGRCEDLWVVKYTWTGAPSCFSWYTMHACEVGELGKPALATELHFLHFLWECRMAGIAGGRYEEPSAPVLCGGSQERRANRRVCSNDQRAFAHTSADHWRRCIS
eukprot:scaffold1696_cov258-Pinguiococcus_pyrenoidosus.AAC.4